MTGRERETINNFYLFFLLESKSYQRINSEGLSAGMMMEPTEDERVLSGDDRPTDVGMSMASGVLCESSAAP